MLRRTEGIVLRSRPLQEADLIVTYLTKDHGILSLYVKSPRKVGSRFGGSLEPVTYARIGFFGKEQAAMPRLTQSDIISPFKRLRESMRTFVRVSELLELTLRVLPEKEPNRTAFSLLLNAFRSLEDEPENPLFTLYYKLHFLMLSGFAPKLEGCGRCGGHGEMFFYNEGTILCSNCAGGGAGYVDVPPPVRNVYRYMTRVRLSVLKRLKVSGDTLKGLESLIDSHINYIVVGRLNSKGFIQA